MFKRELDKAELIVYVMIATYAAFFIYYTFSKHYAFMTYMFDLGVYNHNFWMLLNYGDPKFPFGAIHLFLTIYAINPTPETLLTIQALIIPLGALFIYKLARYQLSDRKIALLLAGIYLLYPPLHGISQFDFHLEAFLPTLFLAAAYFYSIQKWRIYTVTLCFILITMRPAAYLAFFLGLYFLIGNMRDTRIGLKSLKVSLASKLGVKYAIVTLIASGVVISVHNLVTPETVSYADTLSASDLRERIEYFSKIYGPLSFVPFLSPSHLIPALPWITFVLVTPNLSREHLMLYNQYPAYITPFVCLGAISALRRLEPHRKKVIMLLLATTMLYLATVDPVLSNPYPPVTPRWPDITLRDQALTEIIQLIPPQVSVLTQNNIAPHLTNRKEIYISLFNSSIQPDYVLVDTSHFSYDEPNFKPAPAQILPRLIESGRYGLKARCNEILLYQKGYKGETWKPPSCQS